MYDAILFNTVLHKYGNIKDNLKNISEEDKACLGKRKFFITIFTFPGNMKIDLKEPNIRDFKLICRSYLGVENFLPDDFNWIKIKEGLYGGELKDASRQRYK